MRLLAKVCGELFHPECPWSGLSAASTRRRKGQRKEKGELKVKVGDKAPTFESVDETGKTFKSSDIVGKKIVVLYFYPADFTGGCTAQACGFRDDIEKLDSKGVMVIGVSGDSVDTHKLFKAYHKLPFTLLADVKGELAKTSAFPSAKGASRRRSAKRVKRARRSRRATIHVTRS